MAQAQVQLSLKAVTHLPLHQLLNEGFVHHKHLRHPPTRCLLSGTPRALRRRGHVVILIKMELADWLEFVVSSSIVSLVFVVFTSGGANGLLVGHAGVNGVWGGGVYPGPTPPAPPTTPASPPPAAPPPVAKAPHLEAARVKVFITV